MTKKDIKKRNNVREDNIDKRAYKDIILLILFLMSFLVMIDLASAATDCSICHTDKGKAVKAKDTIEISNSTCLKCHSSEYPPVPIGYNTHLVHVGKYSANVDYIKRHPEVAKSMDCNSCHVKIIDCQYCHIKGIPHIPAPLGNNCKGCHGTVDDLFRHPAIEFEIHDIFNGSLGGVEDGCVMCHNPENMRSLKLANGAIVPIQEPHRLCYQCHSGNYNLWVNGSHYSNKTVPSGRDFNMVPQLRVEWENKWRRDNTCTECHNPHNPNELYQLPLMGGNGGGSRYKSVLAEYYLYIIGIVIGLIVIVYVIMTRYGIDLKKEIQKVPIIASLSSKMSRTGLSKITMPKLKMPKLKIPISVSVGDIEDMEKTEVTDKVGVGIEDKVSETEQDKKNDELDRRLEELTDKVKTKPKGKTKRFLNNKDISFILGIIIMFVVFYALFGAFLPIVVAISESMSPHMERGDMIFYTDISRIGDDGDGGDGGIKTYNEEKNKSGYKSFENYGEVILYRPFGEEGVIPYIHRAMYYVKQGDEMWPGGPEAPHAGYITKGDNIITNKQYDQQMDLSYNQPVKREWIIGVASFRIPYIGYIRLLIPV